jgi:hypothetical protein
MSRWNSVRLSDIAVQGQYGLNAAAMKEGQGVRFVRITDHGKSSPAAIDGTRGKAFALFVLPTTAVRLNSE